MGQKGYKSKFDLLTIKAVGSESEFSLENRLFNGACIFLFFMLTMFVPINVILGLYPLAGLFVLCLPILTYFYYLARFKKKLSGSIEFMAISMIVILAINFVYNDGLSGPSLLYFFLVTSLATTISKPRQRFIWVLLYITVGVALISLEIVHPDLILLTYQTEGARMLDIIASFIICMIIIFFNTRFILNNYAREKEISESKSVDLELQKKELEQLNKEKDKLFSIISHDFRSPLAALQTTLELMNSQILSKDEEKELTTQMLAQLKVTSNMLDNVLVWSKAQLSNSGADLIPLHLNDEVNKCLETLRPVLDKKDIQVNKDISEELLIMADTEMLQVILRNLISNACKFSHAGSEIRIRAIKSDGHARIRVEDDGAGIPNSQQGDLFTFEARSTYGTHNEKGIGLGLFLTREFVLRQNGEISFDSIEGQGTAFEVLLPLSTHSAEI